MSDSIRARVNEFPTILKTNVNGQDIRFHQEEKKSPVCGEIMLSVNPIRPIQLNPNGFGTEKLIAIIEPEELIEDPKVT